MLKTPDDGEQQATTSGHDEQQQDQQQNKRNGGQNLIMEEMAERYWSKTEKGANVAGGALIPRKHVHIV